MAVRRLTLFRIQTWNKSPTQCTFFLADYIIDTGGNAKMKYFVTYSTQNDTYTKEFSSKEEAQKFVGLVDKLYPETKHMVVEEVETDSAIFMIA